MKILICGFMGAGKSHWLNHLIKTSSVSDFEFIDLDLEIANFLKILPTQLGEWITAHGWPSFRKIEREKISQFLASKSDGVLSLGAGALSEALLEEVKKDDNVKMVFLHTPFELCYERITGDTNRPLTALKKEELRMLYDERMALYSKADLILNESERKGIEGIKSLVHTLTGLK